MKYVVLTAVVLVWIVGQSHMWAGFQYWAHSAFNDSEYRYYQKLIELAGFEVLYCVGCTGVFLWVHTRWHVIKETIEDVL